jgi:hypothetical protein
MPTVNKVGNAHPTPVERDYPGFLGEIKPNSTQGWS